MACNGNACTVPESRQLDALRRQEGHVYRYHVFGRLVLAAILLVTGSALTRVEPAAAGALAGCPPATKLGTSGDDTLKGTADQDVLVGLAGDDELVGLGANDILCGGPGSDTMIGGAGNDIMLGGGGSDAMDGQVGDDEVYGGEDLDLVIGEGGDDLLAGGNGIDFAHYGFAPPNGIRANLAAHEVRGEGHDRLASTTEGIIGSPFDDEILGDAATNFIEGGKGNDVLDGGDGRDELIHFFAEQGVTVDLRDGTVHGYGRDRISGFESVYGSSFGDVLRGGAGRDDLNGAEGRDELDGRGGIDVCIWGETTRRCERSTRFDEPAADAPVQGRPPEPEIASTPRLATFVPDHWHQFSCAAHVGTTYNIIYDFPHADAWPLAESWGIDVSNTGSGYTTQREWVQSQLWVAWEAPRGTWNYRKSIWVGAYNGLNTEQWPRFWWDGQTWVQMQGEQQMYTAVNVPRSTGPFWVGAWIYWGPVAGTNKTDWTSHFHWQTQVYCPAS